jgi:hypothetical protein
MEEAPMRKTIAIASLVALLIAGSYWIPAAEGG